MKRIPFLLCTLLLLTSCSKKFTADQVLGTWQITAMYENNQSLPVTTTNIYTFESGATYTYTQVETDTTENGSWIFNEDNSVLSLSGGQQTFSYTIIHLTSTEMHWEIKDQNNIEARIELTKQ